jgi:PTS system fructose-specific IIA component
MSNPDLESLISEELIELDKEFNSKIDAIEQLLQLIDGQGKVADKEEALKALKEREEEATTGVGKGIGIPHAKTDAVEQPTVAFIRASEGVDFDAADDKPAQLLFMLLFPAESDEEYLDLLSTISRSLIHDEVREALLEADSKSEVMNIIEEEVAE